MSLVDNTVAPELGARAYIPLVRPQLPRWAPLLVLVVSLAAAPNDALRVGGERVPHRVGATQG